MKKVLQIALIFCALNYSSVTFAGEFTREEQNEEFFIAASLCRPAFNRVRGAIIACSRCSRGLNVEFFQHWSDGSGQKSTVWIGGGKCKTIDCRTCSSWRLGDYWYD